MSIPPPHASVTAAWSTRGRSRPFFEGWFYKAVDAARLQSVAVIPGFFRGLRPEEDYAFVQVYDGATGRVVHQRYEAKCFSVTRETGVVIIGANRFSPQQLTLEMPAAGVFGSIMLRDLTPWPPGRFGTRVMGWFAWIPGLQCYHEVVSLGHRVDGTLSIAGNERDLTGGRGYLEKNWGRSFPGAWVWLQCNHFERPDVSLLLAVARVPLLGGAIRGVTAGHLDGRSFYRLGTYDGARLVGGSGGAGRLALEVANRSLTLEVAVSATSSGPVRERVLVPTAEGLMPGVTEVLNATVDCTLRRRGTVLFRGTGVCASLDVVRPDRLLGAGWEGGDFA